MSPELGALARTLEIPHRAVVTMIGGGGKTSLLFALARESEAAGARVVTATTTKMLLPTPEQSRRVLLVDEDDPSWIETIREALDDSPHVTIGVSRAGDKITSVRPEAIDALLRSGVADRILVEGDGAKHRHLKAPRDGEPVIPKSCAVVVPVVGIDLVGRTFTEETVFRPEIVEALTPYRRGDSITVSMIYDVLFHARGIVERAPSGSRIVPFVSYVDDDRALDHARELARRVVAERPFGIDRVALGNADPGLVRELVTPRADT